MIERIIQNDKQQAHDYHKHLQVEDSYNIKNFHQKELKTMARNTLIFFRIFIPLNIWIVWQALWAILTASRHSNFRPLSPDFHRKKRLVDKLKIRWNNKTANLSYFNFIILYSGNYCRKTWYSWKDKNVDTYLKKSMRKTAMKSVTRETLYPTLYRRRILGMCSFDNT